MTSQASNQKPKRELLELGQEIGSETTGYTVLDVLGSGGFGDVYKVCRQDNQDQFYALKTELEIVKDRLRRLKIEAEVLAVCGSAKRRHFLSLIDKGRTPAFKFIVMQMVGPTLDKVRSSLAEKQYTKSTATKIGVQLLEAVRDLHALGWLHRDLKPSNFAVGLEDRSIIFMLDFGIAKKFLDKAGKHILPRYKVAFMGTVRFASRAAQRMEEQSRRDDLESLLFVMADTYNESYLQWRGQRNQMLVIQLKDAFVNERGPAVDAIFKNLPAEYAQLLRYVNKLEFDQTPSYDYMINELKTSIRGCSKPLDWTTDMYKAPTPPLSTPTTPRATAVATRYKPSFFAVGTSAERLGRETRKTASNRSKESVRRTAKKSSTSGERAKPVVMSARRSALAMSIKRRSSSTVPTKQMDAEAKEEETQKSREK